MREGEIVPTWDWRALRRPVVIALGIVLLATMGAVGDEPVAGRVAVLQPASSPSSSQRWTDPASASAPEQDSGGGSGPRSSPAARPQRPALDQLPQAQPTPPAAPPSARRPEGAEADRAPAGTLDYLPTQAELIAPNGQYAPVNTELRIRFDLPARSHSGLEQSFRMEPAVPGRLDWPDLRTLRFRPQTLAFATRYQIRLSETETGRQWAWSFSTMRKVTLTFDDCPSSPAAAQQLLSFLRQHRVKAMTFPTGQCVRRYPWLVPALLADGHLVCNHTYSHADLPKLPDAQLMAEIAGGVHAGCNLLRPPYGDWDGPGGRVERIAAQQGYRLQLWDVDTLDWTGLSAQAIVNRVIEGGGGVVLMHFQGPHTLEALRQLDVGPLTGQG
jgi:peptidoglycan/xylan/chitin deacetylase (PgdA/CDA1 family)